MIEAIKLNKLWSLKKFYLRKIELSPCDVIIAAYSNFLLIVIELDFTLLKLNSTGQKVESIMMVNATLFRIRRVPAI